MMTMQLKIIALLSKNNVYSSAEGDLLLSSAAFTQFATHHADSVMFVLSHPQPRQLMSLLFVNGLKSPQPQSRLKLSLTHSLSFCFMKPSVPEDALSKASVTNVHSSLHLIHIVHRTNAQFSLDSHLRMDAFSSFFYSYTAKYLFPSGYHCIMLPLNFLLRSLVLHELSVPLERVWYKYSWRIAIIIVALDSWILVYTLSGCICAMNKEKNEIKSMLWKFCFSIVDCGD